MKVKELIRELEELDPDRIVILSTDPEGNGYSPLCSFFLAAYSKTNGEVGLEGLTPELKLQGYTRLDVVKGKPAVVLVPTN
jgi:hypothetical protein